jgi:hypothetical protein
MAFGIGCSGLSSITFATSLQKVHSPGTVVGPLQVEHIFKFTIVVSPRCVNNPFSLAFKKER